MEDSGRLDNDTGLRHLGVPPKDIYRRLLPRWFSAHMDDICPLGQQRCSQRNGILAQYNDLNVFIAIPYKDYQFEDLIRGVVSDAGMTPVFAKDTLESDIIFCNVCQNMRKCRLSVADISTSNANVMLELGMMLQLGMKCAILRDRNQPSPSDFLGRFCVLYSDSTELRQNLTDWLRQQS